MTAPDFALVLLVSCTAFLVSFIWLYVATRVVSRAVLRSIKESREPNA